MRKKKGLIHLLLLISMFGGLALTAQDWITCQGDLPDEFLDLAIACQNPTLPVLAPHLNTHPFLIRPLKLFWFERVNLLLPLRC